MRFWAAVAKTSSSLRRLEYLRPPCDVHAPPGDPRPRCRCFLFVFRACLASSTLIHMPGYSAVIVYLKPYVPECETYRISCTRPVLSSSCASCATHPLLRCLLSTSVLIPSQLTVFPYVSIQKPHVYGARPNFLPACSRKRCALSAGPSTSSCARHSRA